MPRPAPGSPWLPPRTGAPHIIGHRGNSRDEVVRFLGSGADFIEIDLWVHEGNFESRHERALYPLPLLFERWYLKLRSPHFDLSDTVAAIDGRAYLFLDLKNGGSHVVPLVRETLRRFPGLHLSASASDWATLRALHDAVDEVDVFYSMEVPERLDLFLSVIERDHRPLGVSCRARMLTPAIVDRCHALGLKVVAWTVDEPDAARRLAAWGVDAITTHRPTEIRAAVAL
jgi:glycerophosphoryl diester phosphodiesterase